jgi:MYXO-CTERM domain-containing protein
MGTFTLRSCRFRAAAAALGVMALGTGTASADVFGDSVGEQFPANGDGGNFSHLDISSVEVTNTPTALSFKINLTGNPTSPDWGKYMIGIDSLAGGDTAGNGWGRPISMPSGMDYWVGSWVDFGGGAEVRHYTGSGWVLDHASYDAANPLATPVVTSNSVTLTVPLGDLGLSNGGQFSFDVYTSGGGGTDAANDALGNAGQTETAWNGPYSSTGALPSYQVAVAPEPGSLVLLGVAALGVAAPRRRRRESRV